ncbi:TPA: thiolase domain-containing protein [Candidatus Bipolaricaulota bacterium]|nr:thiolase domain-containing protein [Candidatus Bipolaricaulota bacterium]
MGRRMRGVAVIGAGMTLFASRMMETGKEMSFEAAKMALDEAGLSLQDIEAVILGSAPDAFDGIHKKGENLLDGAGGANKPYMRIFTGGGTGVMIPIVGWWHVASGLFDIVLLVCEEKMSSIQPHAQSAFGHIWDPMLDRPLKPNLVWIFAMEMQQYMHKYNVRREDIALVSVKNKRNAVDHPCAQLADPEITVEKVLDSEPMALPVRRLDISPPSDGAVALVLASIDVARELKPDKLVTIDGVGWCIDTTMWTNRELAFPKYLARAAEQAYKMAGIKDPKKEIHVAEPYDPFNYKELQHMEGLLLCEPGEAGRLTREGVTQRNGRLPVCPSGGLLGVGNPIAAAGLMKAAEIYWQLAREAGKRQVKNDPVTGVCQAWGDLMQFSSVVVMRRR